MKREITIIVQDPRWKGYGPTVKRAIAAVLEQQKSKNVSVAVLLTDDAEIRQMNRDFRAKDKPTNVLSFPDGGVDNEVCQLGDIVIAYETVVGEAQAQDKPLKNHLTHLAIHGALHLLGYDHEADGEAEIMEALEVKILDTMGVADPYCHG